MNGLPELGSARSRLLAIGLAFLVVGSLARFGALPLWRHYEQNAEALQEQNYQLERYRSVARRLNAYQTRLEQLLAEDEVGQYALSQDSPALAAAELQEQAKALIEMSGGRLTALRVLPTKRDGAFQRISVNVRATLENDALQSVLHALEITEPYLQIDNLVITSRQRRNARRARRRPGSVPLVVSLEVTFDLAGLMRPGAASQSGAPAA